MDRERDIHDLTSLIGKRNLARCRTPGCDRYILQSERDDCPHCNERHIDIGLGRIKDTTLLGQDPNTRADARAEVGRELEQIGKDFREVRGSGVLPMALMDFGSRLTSGAPLMDGGRPWVIDAQPLQGEGAGDEEPVG
jgi:hypothetical protein